MLKKLAALSVLTEYRIVCTAWLARSSVHVEVRMSVRAPLAQNPGPGVYNIHEVSIAIVQVSRPVISHVKNYSRIQSCKNGNQKRSDQPRLDLTCDPP